MSIKIIICYLFLSFSSRLITESVYNLLWDNHYLSFNKNKIIISDKFNYPITLFRIKIISNSSCYYIEEINTNYTLGFSLNKELLFYERKEQNNLFISWEFINVKENIYVIKNKNNCYITASKINFTCENIPKYKASLFKLVKVYEEVTKNRFDNEIIEKEPIDLLIKYIDLRDTNLKRNKIHQIEKDYDNEELKYSIRSVMQNIPWIRKIFILMPNEKVRFFKNYSLINDKIIYVKDKMLLGHDSSNINSFLFTLWKMKKFGIADNFIVMDDDCFIGQKLSKSDFFQIENGKVVPSIITSNILSLDINSVKKTYAMYKSIVLRSKVEQNTPAFDYSLFIAYLLIMNIFQKDHIFSPKTNHQAIPVNINEMKEIYKYVYKSEYKSATLDSLYRAIGYVQFQQFYISYIFIKYNRKIIKITSKYIDIKSISIATKMYPLFCVNRGPGFYSYKDLYKARLAMEYLFPIPTSYEIKDNSFIDLSYNIVLSTEKGKKVTKKKLKEITKKNVFLNSEFILLSFLMSILFKLLSLIGKKYYKKKRKENSFSLYKKDIKIVPYKDY